MITHRPAERRRGLVRRNTVGIALHKRRLPPCARLTLHISGTYLLLPEPCRRDLTVSLALVRRVSQPDNPMELIYSEAPFMPQSTILPGNSRLNSWLRATPGYELLDQKKNKFTRDEEGGFYPKMALVLSLANLPRLLRIPFVPESAMPIPIFCLVLRSRHIFSPARI